MANIPYSLPRSTFVVWLSNLVAVLAAGDLVPIDVLDQAAWSAEIDALRQDLEDADTDAGTFLAQYHAAVAAADSARSAALDRVKLLKFAMLAAPCAGAEFALAGLPVPVVDPVSYVALTPSELAAEGFSNGVNRLTFLGNNVSGLVVYVVFCQIGGTGDFILVGTTSKQRFTHSGVEPGTTYRYKILARSASNDSAFSNEALVYG